MQDLDQILSIEIPPTNWRKFYFDDEFFFNRAILDLQSQSLTENFPIRSSDLIKQLRQQEDQTMRLVSSRLFPNLILISLQ